MPKKCKNFKPVDDVTTRILDAFKSGDTSILLQEPFKDMIVQGQFDSMCTTLDKNLRTEFYPNRIEVCWCFNRPFIAFVADQENYVEIEDGIIPKLVLDDEMPFRGHNVATREMKDAMMWFGKQVIHRHMTGGGSREKLIL